MVLEYDSQFIQDLYNAISKYNPAKVATRRASKYTRTYYKYHHIKIVVSRETLTGTITSISITKV